MLKSIENGKHDKKITVLNPVYVKKCVANSSYPLLLSSPLFINDINVSTASGICSTQFSVSKIAVDTNSSVSDFPSDF